LSDTPKDPLREGEGTAISVNAREKVAAHAVDSPSVASPWARIKEHKIAQWTLAYAAFAFALLHGATLMSDALEWPHAVVRVLTLVLVVGLPIAPTLAWYHGVRALKRVSGGELILITLLLLIGGSLLWLYPRPTEHATPAVASKATPPLSASSTASAVFAPPAHSIAVLPFVNMSGDAKQEYFSDGISEELLNSLSRLNDLQVAARTSSFSFKGKDVDVATIAHKLNVGAVLEGSVRRAGKTVRITVQLINAVSGFHMWSQTYDRNFTDILKVQTEVATSVAQQLELKLIGNVAAKIELGGTHNARAYDAYLRGTQLHNSAITINEAGGREAMRREALAAFDEAISLDPAYAAAYAWRANLLAGLTEHTKNPSARARLEEQALAAAERAVALAPQFGDAHVALAYRYSDSLDFAAEAREMTLAVTLSPGSSSAQRDYANMAASVGYFDIGIAAGRRAVSLDPRNWLTHYRLGRIFLFARRFSEALAVLHNAEVLEPKLHYVQSSIIEVLLASGQYQQARHACELPSTPLDDGDRYASLVLAYRALGLQADAARELERFKTIAGDIGPDDLAAFYSQLGDTAAALRWLNKAEEQKAEGLGYLKTDWHFDPIRKEPQFQAVVARMKFPGRDAFQN
jgi:TolB-like protein/Tfp pilus assembly protein PilF